MDTPNMVLALQRLFPTARFPEDIALFDNGAGPRIIRWRLGAPQPTPEELAAALPAAQAAQQARRDLAELEGMLNERYRLYNRALAGGNAQDASDIQGEIKDILAALKEARNAVSPS